MSGMMVLAEGVKLQSLPAAPEWHPAVWQVVVCILFGLAAAAVTAYLSYRLVDLSAAAIAISLVLGFIIGIVVAAGTYVVMREASETVVDWRQETSRIQEANIRRVRDHYGLRTLDLDHEQERREREREEKPLWQKVGDVLKDYVSSIFVSPHVPWDGDPGNEGHWAVTYTVRDDTLPAFGGTRMRRDGDDRLRLVKEKPHEATLVIRGKTAFLFDKKDGKELQ